MQAHSFRTPRTARYWTFGCEPGKASDIWLLLHGYSQSGRSILRRFAELGSDSTLLIAPEGLSRFYRQGFSGSVGASWMTREDRDSEISDYVTYLNGLYAQLSKTWPDTARVHIVGFSQGAATASRWVQDGHVGCDSFILWGGVFPPDLDLKLTQEALLGAQVFFVRGEHDPYWDEAGAQALREQIAALGLVLEEIVFEGGHDVTREGLCLLTKRL